MNDFENNNGKLEGFDSVNGEETGYTVTPEGGFYTKSREDIIQDNDFCDTAYKAEPINTETYNPPVEENKEPIKNNFFPNGEYSGSNSYYKAPKNSYKPPKVKDKKGFSLAAVIIAALLSAVIGTVGSISFLTYRNISTKTGETASKTEISGGNVNINIDETAESVVEAVATKVIPSVIGIRTTTTVTGFFGGNSESKGEGSGVVYTSDGYIITNYHVISSAVTNKSTTKIEVFTEGLDGKSYEAKVIGYNIASDLAVIKIEVSGLTPVELADSSSLKVGQYVITIGNPGGLEFMDSVTYGVVSGVDRVVSANSEVKLIQTDAAINPGNSGGALVNTKGQLVGINSSKIVSEEFEGMGFAIPSNTVDQVCKKIIEKQNDPEPYLGITISQKYTAEVLEGIGYPTGAVVSSIAESSPAEAAGLKRADIITEFNGTKISDYTVLDKLIEDLEPNQEIDVKIYRSGRYYTTQITVGSNNEVN